MVPRPRNKANKNLPQNLYFDARRSTYRYRRPTDGKWFQFGTDRIKAIDAAKQLNLEFMRGGADLVGAVMSASSESFATFLDTYERDVLPPRGWLRARSACTRCTSGASASSSRARPSTRYRFGWSRKC